MVRIFIFILKLFNGLLINHLTFLINSWFEIVALFSELVVSFLMEPLYIFYLFLVFVVEVLFWPYLRVPFELMLRMSKYLWLK